MKESSLPYLLVPFYAFLIPCHLVVALSSNLSDSTYTKSVITCQQFFFLFKGHFKKYLVEKGRTDLVMWKILSVFFILTFSFVLLEVNNSLLAMSHFLIV